MSCVACLREIAEGDEILISYVDPLENWQQRQDHLDQYGIRAAPLEVLCLILHLTSLLCIASALLAFSVCPPAQLLPLHYLCPLLSVLRL